MEIPEIIARQREHFLSGATQPAESRKAALRKLLVLMDDCEDALLEALHADLGTGPQEAFATEIAFVRGEVRHALKRVSRWMRPRRASTPSLAWPARARVHREPFGIVLIMGPWNYPVQLLLTPLVSALAAGNCVLLKPSEHAPRTAEVIGRAFARHFPDEFVTVVNGGRETAEALVEQKFDKIFFTGGTGTGRAVMAAAARHLTPVTLELGGKCPCIVRADAPLRTTARRILWGKFMNAGQTCVAPDHVWAERSIARDLVETMKRELVSFHGENPALSAEYGRLVNRAHFDRVAAFLGDGEIAAGGDADPDSLYLAPTILTGVAPDAPVMNEEIFGPVLPVLEFDDLHEVLATIAAQPPPLAVYLFTRDRESQRLVVGSTRSGGVCINDTIVHILGRDLPFGGVGESGMGRYHGRAGFDCFTYERPVMRRSLRIDPDFRYPPPRVPLATLKRLLRFLG